MKHRPLPDVGIRLFKAFEAFLGRLCGFLATSLRPLPDRVLDRRHFLAMTMAISKTAAVAVAATFRFRSIHNPMRCHVAQ